MGRRTKSFLNGRQPIIPKAYCSGNTTVPLDLKPICPSGCYLKNKSPIPQSAFQKKNLKKSKCLHTEYTGKHKGR